LILLWAYSHNRIRHIHLKTVPFSYNFQFRLYPSCLNTMVYYNIYNCYCKLSNKMRMFLTWLRIQFICYTVTNICWGGWVDAYSGGFYYFSCVLVFLLLLLLYTSYSFKCFNSSPLGNIMENHPYNLSCGKSFLRTL